MARGIGGKDDRHASSGASLPPSSALSTAREGPRAETFGLMGHTLLT
jgi:hypothetical protein